MIERLLITSILVTGAATLSVGGPSVRIQWKAQLSRRDFGLVLGTASSVLATPTSPALAKGQLSSQEDLDKQNILKGYERLTYLLDNWVSETTVCGSNDNPYVGKNGCERNPTKVMDYLGFRSTKDPLFKADKTMRRLEVLVPSDRESDFIEAVETFAEAAEEASNMAFVSSWGEANPGGGKDRVELFIERAKKNVVDARTSLKTVIDILSLQS